MKFDTDEDIQNFLPLTISLSTGLALFWFNFYISLFCNPVLDAAAVNVYTPLPSAFACGLVVIMFLGYKYPGSLITTRGKRILQILVCVSPAIIGIMLFVRHTTAIPIPEIGALIAGFLSGLGAGALLFLWMKVIFKLSDNLKLRVFCWSMALGAFFYFTANALPYGLNIWFIFASLPASLILLIVLEKNSNYDKSVSRDSQKPGTVSFPFSFFILNALYGIVFGVAISFHSDAENTMVENAMIAIFIILAAFFILKMSSISPEKQHRQLVAKSLFPICIVYLLVVPCADISIVSGLSFIILSCWICFMLVTFCLACTNARLSNRSVIASVSERIAPIILGIGGGYILGYMFISQNLYNSRMALFLFDTIVIAFVVVIAVVPSTTLTMQLQDENEKSDSENSADASKGRWRKRCEDVIKKYDLSPREAEVFFLLAKGHESKYIESKLYLSPSTVKTHRYNIYKKINVKSREEILSIIENTEITHE